MRKRRVLIIDDSEILRRRLEDLLLSMPDVEVVGATGDQSLGEVLLQELKPDVVILDIRLRSGNGINILKQFKNKNSRPVFIVLSNFSNAQYRKRCQDAGADYFLDKSSDFEKIPKIVQELEDKP